MRRRLATLAATGLTLALLVPVAPGIAGGDRQGLGAARPARQSPGPHAMHYPNVAPASRKAATFAHGISGSSTS